MLFLVLVGALALALGRPLVNAFMGNPAVNGVILLILLAGIVYIFRQVLLLDPEIDWIENFRYHEADDAGAPEDRKSTRLNSSHVRISYAVFCLKKKTTR